jgi:hypothetical protein
MPIANFPVQILPALHSTCIALTALSGKALHRTAPLLWWDFSTAEQYRNGAAEAQPSQGTWGECLQGGLQVAEWQPQKASMHRTHTCAGECVR